MEYMNNLCDRITKYNEAYPPFLQRERSGQSQMDETEMFTDYDSNYLMLQNEESIIDGLKSLNFGHVKSKGYGKVSGMFFLESLARTGISIELKLGATFDDLVRLLKKWCLEGPYAPDACVFMCHNRRREVSISSTIETDAGKWRYLALIMKECLKQEETELALVRMSPMFRYYGDLYPDNGRDSDASAADEVFVCY